MEGFVICMNILQYYGVISITGLGRGINVRSRVSNVISSVNINNEETVKVYIGWFTQSYRRIIVSHVDTVNNNIVKWEMRDVIVKSNNEYARPLVVVTMGT